MPKHRPKNQRKSNAMRTSWQRRKEKLDAERTEVETQLRHLQTELHRLTQDLDEERSSRSTERAQAGIELRRLMDERDDLRARLASEMDTYEKEMDDRIRDVAAAKRAGTLGAAAVRFSAALDDAKDSGLLYALGRVLHPDAIEMFLHAVSRVDETLSADA